jgi:hypothetical protein
MNSGSIRFIISYLPASLLSGLPYKTFRGLGQSLNQNPVCTIRALDKRTNCLIRLHFGGSLFKHQVGRSLWFS